MKNFYELLNPAKIAVTIGDIGGIGVEIIVKSLNSKKLNTKPQDIILVGSKKAFFQKAEELNLKIPPEIQFADIEADLNVFEKGNHTAKGGEHAFQALKSACKLVKCGKVKTIATAPVSKEALNLAEHYFNGQTEVIAHFLNGSNPEMLFVAGDLKVLLLTRHLKISSVAKKLSIEGVIASILALNNSLIKNFKIAQPKLAICGLNPHAGENGILGEEEIKIINPALEILRKNYAVSIDDPFPADTLWAKTAKTYLNGEKLAYDAYIACYHDQGLIPVKMLAMEKAVNTTINLSAIRTSPSHGTAYDIAGKNIADFQSMIEAINLAYFLA